MTAHDAAPTDIQQSAVYNTLPPPLPWLRYETSRGLITGGGGGELSCNRRVVPRSGGTRATAPPQAVDRDRTTPHCAVTRSCVFPNRDTQHSFNSRLTTCNPGLCFNPCDAMLARYYSHGPVSVCVSHKLEFCRTAERIELGFFDKIFV